MKYTKILVATLILNFLSPLVASASVVENRESSNISASMHLKGVNQDNKYSIEYSANATEFATGDQYEGSLHVVNTDGNTVSKGTKIILSIPKEAVDYNSWDFTDPNITALFDVVVSKETGTVTFSLKADIHNTADIKIYFSTSVIGTENTSYPVSALVQYPDGSATSINVLNNKIIIPKKDNPNPYYGLLNMFWGTEHAEMLQPNIPNNFIGKSPTDINHTPTGVFTRKENSIQNFIEINPEENDVLGSSDHYVITYTINSTAPDSTIKFDRGFDWHGSSKRNYSDWIGLVFDATTGKDMAESIKDVSKENDHTIKLTLKSPHESSDGSMKANHKYILNFNTLASNDSDVYVSDSTLDIQPDSTHSTSSKEKTTSKSFTPETFRLNNIFSSEGESKVFPNITAKDKIFKVGELTSENILSKLNIGVFAQDPIDGNLTFKITTNPSDLLTFRNIPGIYTDKVSYSVTNSKGYSSSKSIMVTILDNQVGADVTVKYEDEAGNKLADNVVKSGNIGDQYTTEQKAIKGYTFKEVKGNPNGIFSDKAQTVTYVYTKDPVKAADVTVKYEDEAGNKLADNVVKSGNIGDHYTTEQKAIKGYTFKEVKGNPNGIFSDKAQTVTYVYKDPVKAADSNHTDNNDTQTKTTISNKQNNNDASKKLPQTSAKQNTVLLTIIGALMITISGVKLIRRKE